MLRLLKLPRPRVQADQLESGEGVDPLGALVHGARQGDHEAQRTLIVTLGPALLKTVRGVLGAAHPDVEDVLQEAMAAVHSALPGFRGECRTSHFACRIAVQTAMNARRRASYRNRYTPSVAPEALAELARDEPSPADERVANERREVLRRLLDELPRTQAEALVLHTVLGYSVEETARALHTPANTVRSRLRGALAALRDRIGADRVLLDVLEVRS